MSFNDIVPKRVKDKILSWSLPKALLKEHLISLQAELSTREVEEYTRQIVAPIRALVLEISVSDPETGESRDFVFWVNSTEHPGDRIVVDALDRSQPPPGTPTGNRMGGDPQ